MLRIVRWIGAVLVLYLSSYALLSTTGGWVVAESGEHRLGVAIADCFKWFPRYGRCERFRAATGDHTFRGDTLGFCFAPLILFDQSLVHRTIPFIDTDANFVEPIPAPPLSQYHPFLKNRFHGRFPDERTEAESP